MSRDGGGDDAEYRVGDAPLSLNRQQRLPSDDASTTLHPPLWELFSEFVTLPASGRLVLNDEDALHALDALLESSGFGATTPFRASTIRAALHALEERGVLWDAHLDIEHP